MTCVIIIVVVLKEGFNVVVDEKLNW